MAINTHKTIVAGGVEEYILNCPIEVQSKLKEIRAAIRTVAPDSIETVSYFQIPGFSYGSYDYNGVLVWFSYKKPYVRLHVRPPVIQDHKNKLAGYATTKSIVSFPVDKELPIA
jgi:uncharacterized protein YdhG (YjbR/CyaY superfamily)